MSVIQPVRKHGRWRCADGTGQHAVGYCAGWQEAERFAGCSKALLAILKVEVDRLRPLRDRYHTAGHATAAAAQACYRDYLLDTRLLLIPPERDGESHNCDAAGCDVTTAGQARLLGHAMYFLCPLHLNRETVSKLLDAEAASLLVLCHSPALEPPC